MAYRVLKDRVIRGEKMAAAGDVVWICKGYDYGWANDDSHFFGEPHISVTLNEDGSYPFFTIPLSEVSTHPTGAAQ